MTDNTADTNADALRSLAPQYAQGLTDTAQVAAFVQAHMALHPDYFWMALVDTAFDALGHAPLHLEGINCYEGDELRDLRAVAPRLVALDIYDTGAQRLAELLAHCNGRPMLSLVASDLSAWALARHWEPLHWLHMSDNQRMVLRFADTRVLPTLGTLLHPEQWAALTQPVAHWLYIDRNGRAAACELPPPGTQAVPRLELTNEQIATLVAACEPDAALDQVFQEIPEVAPGWDDLAVRFEGLREIFALAACHGIESWPDKMALAMAELITQGAIRAHAELPLLLKMQDWEPGQLRERLNPLIAQMTA